MNDSRLNTKRRFIAGAVCPRCKAMDTIVMWREEGVDHRECVSCDFAEQTTFQESTHQPLVKEQVVEELPTRVNRPAAQAPRVEDPDVQIVKIIE